MSLRRAPRALRPVAPSVPQTGGLSFSLDLEVPYLRTEKARARSGADPAAVSWRCTGESLGGRICVRRSDAVDGVLQTTPDPPSVPPEHLQCPAFVLEQLSCARRSANDVQYDAPLPRARPADGTAPFQTVDPNQSSEERQRCLFYTFRHNNPTQIRVVSGVVALPVKVVEDGKRLPGIIQVDRLDQEGASTDILPGERCTSMFLRISANLPCEGGFCRWSLR